MLICPASASAPLALHLQAQLERNSLETARRGLLFTVLGIILVDAEKAMGQDTLYGHVSRALHLSDGSGALPQLTLGSKLIPSPRPIPAR